MIMAKTDRSDRLERPVDKRRSKGVPVRRCERCGSFTDGECDDCAILAEQIEEFRHELSSDHFYPRLAGEVDGR
jgi:hypothetical protein